MALSLKLPNASGKIEVYALRGTMPVKPAAGVKFNRIAYSAAHVVADPLAADAPVILETPPDGIEHDVALLQSL